MYKSCYHLREVSQAVERQPDHQSHDCRAKIRAKTRAVGCKRCDARAEDDLGSKPGGCSSYKMQEYNAYRYMMLAL